MSSERTQILEKGLMYGLECTLATIEKYCMMRTISPTIIKRQISIAQSLLNYYSYAELHSKGTRSEVIVRLHNKSVHDWACTIRNRYVPDKPLKQIRKT